MEEYLETIVTVLIGLGAFLISALRKKKASGTKSVENGEKLQLIEEDNNEVYEPFSEYKKVNNITNSQNSNEHVIHHKNEIGDENHQVNEISDQNNTPNNLRKTLKQKTKRRFNARKAIIYSTIIDKKYS